MPAAQVTAKPVIVLLGNYTPDRDEGMLHFCDLIHRRLVADGYSVEEIAPQPYLGSLAGGDGGLASALRNFDKYVVFPLGLLSQSSHIREKYLGRKIVVHVCDQINALYATLMRRWFPVVVTCHDLLAIRGALGEDTSVQMGAIRRHFLKEALQGLKRAHYVACATQTVRDDLIRLAGNEVATHSEVIPVAPEEPANSPEIERMMRAYEDVYQRV